MKFSIVTSFYNTSEYVEKLYNSLLSQTYQNWEWIVTDDFSKNSAKEQLLEISKRDSRVKYIEQKFKQEIYYNPHKYSSLDSNFILHLGSDDMVFPKTLEVYKHFFILHPDVICLVSGGTRIRENQSWMNYIFGDVRNLNSADWRTKYGESETMLVTKAWRHIPFPTLDFNPNNKYQKRLEDLNILLRLEEIGKILCLNRNLCDITVRPKSLSNDSDFKFENNAIVSETRKNILEDTDARRNNKSFYSMKKLFEDEFNFLSMFYYGDISKSKDHCIINLLNPSISYRQQDVLKDLYFDFDFKTYDFCPLTPHNYFIIQSDEDFNFLKENIKTLSKYKNLTIYTSNSSYNLANFMKQNMPHSYHIYSNKMWFRVVN